MITSNQCLKKYGDPNLLITQQEWFELWIVPMEIRSALSHVRFTAIGTIGFPKRIFINKEFRPVLEKALRSVIDKGYTKSIISWDGCFVIRKKVSGSSMSLHSWAIAIDINASSNRYGVPPTISRNIVKCFVDAGCDWGGYWSKPDGMHFQLKAPLVLHKGVDLSINESEKTVTIHIEDRTYFNQMVAEIHKTLKK